MSLTCQPWHRRTVLPTVTRRIFRSHCDSDCPSRLPTQLFAGPPPQQPCHFFSLLECYFLVGRSHGGRGKAQEPSGEGAEDQVEAQGLPKMAACNAGGHEGIRQQQDGCPASQKERDGQSRLPPGSMEHPNERVQTR